jgi:hypothetical protein
LKHIPTKARDNFKSSIAPLTRLKAGLLSDPWQVLKLGVLQAIIDEVYGLEKYQLMGDSPFCGLVSVPELS